MQVHWCHLHDRRMTAPFFFETIVEAMREPFNLVFQQRTPIEALDELPQGVPVAGFIFHMSRCGSTLVSQALAALDCNIVVSEAAPLRSILRAAGAGRATPGQASVWLRGLLNAYAQPRFASEARLIVKFMAADVLDIGLVRRAFPYVPWIFMTRDPAEILASQDRSLGVDLMLGQLAPELVGIVADVWTMGPNEYASHVLAAFARAGHGAYASGGGMILDYAELPDALQTKVCPHFGLPLDQGAIDRMAAVGGRHSKAPGTPYVLERDPNRTGAARFRSIATPITGDVMDALAMLRTA